MSTRCNILVSLGESRVFIYRHCDGYLAETGADILEKLKAATGEPEARRSPSGAVNLFLRSLLEERYEKASYETEPRPVYELTSGWHGDIERAYWVDFAEDGVKLNFASRPRSYPNLETWIANAGPYSLDAFRFLINAERRDMNKRIAELRASSKAYAECADYPEVTS